jgi:hypothetical protein
MAVACQLLRAWQLSCRRPAPADGIAVPARVSSLHTITLCGGGERGEREGIEWGLGRLRSREEGPHTANVSWPLKVGWLLKVGGSERPIKVIVVTF